MKSEAGVLQHVTSRIDIKKLACPLLMSGYLLAGTVQAASCVTGSSSEMTLQGIFDSVTTAPIAGSSSVSADSDCLADSQDSSWSIGGDGTSEMTLIIEIAANAGSNTLGIYDAANSSSLVQLYDGAASQSDQVALSIKADGSVFVNSVDTGIDFTGNNFGYYLGTASNGTFFSDTSLNADGADHMLAYQGKGDTIQVPGLAADVWTQSAYAFAWEDLMATNADFDFNDYVVLVDSVQPAVIPIPAAIWLFGSGLLGFIGIARRRKP